MKKLQWLGGIVVLIAFALVIRDLFPKRVEVARPPRIVTVWDTVQVVDTAWVQRLRVDTVKVNVLERVTVTVPETLYVFPTVHAIVGASFGQKVGDSSLVAGYSLAPVDSLFLRRNWVAQFYTLGPARSLVMDGSVPRMTFYDPPPKGCDFWCSLGKYVTGGTIGAGAGYALCKL